MFWSENKKLSFKSFIFLSGIEKLILIEESFIQVYKDYCRCSDKHNY